MISYGCVGEDEQNMVKRQKLGRRTGQSRGLSPRTVKRQRTPMSGGEEQGSKKQRTDGPETSDAEKQKAVITLSGVHSKERQHYQGILTALRVCCDAGKPSKIPCPSGICILPTVYTGTLQGSSM